MDPTDEVTRVGEGDVWILGELLRPCADELGWRDRRAVGPGRRARRRLPRALVGLGTAIVLLALSVGALRVAHAPPFVPMAQVPRLLHLPQADAIQRLRDAGFKVQVLSYRRSLPSSLYHRVLGVSSLPATHLARGSIVTLYTAVPRSTHS